MERSGRPTADAVSASGARDRVDGSTVSIDEAIQDAARTDGGIDLPEHAPRLTSSKQIDEEAKSALRDRLRSDPWEFSFTALVRRIEALHHDRPGFGRSDRAEQDPIRFCQEPSLAFAPCTVSEFKDPTNKAEARLFVNFIGLLGPNGPMPLHLTEFARSRERINRDPTLARFFDLFNHRMVSLFYRAWSASQMPASFDRWEPPLPGPVTTAERELQLARDTSRYSIYIGSAFGVGMDSFRHRDAVSDVAKLHYAGRLASPHKNAEGLRDILSDYFRIPVEIEEFAGRYVEVPEQYRCSLGVTPPSGAAAGQLGGVGGGAMCGSTYFDCGGAFRLRLGPMGLAEYNRLLPGTRSARRLAAWIRNYLGDELWWDAQLVLKKEEVPGSRLGGGARLGWTSWVLSAGSPENRADLALRSAF
ncbi:MAG: type VI secretion system baseplate subunit TssG [Phycisphaerales bacterium]